LAILKSAPTYGRTLNPTNKTKEGQMKLSNALKSYQKYHSFNSKKKYAEKLWVSFHPLLRRI